MENNIKDILLNSLNEAELVLVGIGEEFCENGRKMEEIPEIAEFLKKIEEREERHWMRAYAEKYYLEKYKPNQVVEAYAVLEKLLKDKNYFVVSTRTDDYLYASGIRKERMVMPCGGYRFQQCGSNCEKQIIPVNEKTAERINLCISGGKEPEEVPAPLCPKCGEKLVFNQVSADHYAEEGYLEQWNHYTKWLQGTVNKKLCVLELGVGMKYPTVIRWPFEKIVFFNQKSVMFRVHSKLYQLTEEIKDRGYKIDEKPVDFLINRFV